MNVLWVKAGKLLPVDTGGRIRTYNLLIHLARIHNVTFYSYYGGPRDLEYEQKLAEILPGAIPHWVPRMDRLGFKGLLDYLRFFSSSLPYAVSKFSDREVKKRVSSLLSSHAFDVAVCDFLSASLNFSFPTPIPAILFQHNIESELWSRLAETERNPLRKFAYAIEAKKMCSYERETVARFDRVWAVSQRDLEQMLPIVGPERTSIVETGVDTSQFRSTQDRHVAPDLVIFTGSMDWEPNIDCVEYFCQDIWPAVRREIPSVRFRIVGRNPHTRVKRLASDSVEVTGSVPSVLDHLHEAAVVVVPLRAGGGTRLKIYESMAAGKAIVSTTLGAEGLAVTDNENILLADDAPSFAAKVIALLRDSLFRNRIGNSAARIAEKHDWSNVAARCGQLMTDLAGKGAVQLKNNECLSARR